MDEVARGAIVALDLMREAVVKGALGLIVKTRGEYALCNKP